MVCKWNQKHLCIPCLVGRWCSTRKVQCIPKVSGCSLESPGTERHWAGTCLALLPCQPWGWMRKPGVETETPARDKPGKNKRKLLWGGMETSMLCPSASHRQPYTHRKAEHPSASRTGNADMSIGKDRISRTTHGLFQGVQSMSNPTCRFFHPTKKSPHKNGL